MLLKQKSLEEMTSPFLGVNLEYLAIFFAKLSFVCEAASAAMIFAFWLRNKDVSGSAGFKKLEFAENHFLTSSGLALDASNSVHHLTKESLLNKGNLSG